MKVKCLICGEEWSLHHLMNHRELGEISDKGGRGEDEVIEYLRELSSTLAPLTTALPVPLIQDKPEEMQETEA